VDEAIRVAIIGMGGFAGSHHHAVHKLENEGRCKLVCTCDPNPSAFAALADELSFSSRGVAVHTDYRQMLDQASGGLDLVTVPTPVPLHAEMRAAGVERGLAVYLEKPPTLDYRELEAMIETEQTATKLTNVGFNLIVEPELQALKARLLAREFGTVRRVCFSGLTPRAVSYFRRASWAARLTLDGRLVLDSCMGNARAHHVHSSLFLAGTGEVFSWGEAQTVEAELYRAHAIESMDTVFAKATTSEGVELRLAISHACAPEHNLHQWVVCDKAVIHYDAGSGFRVVRGGAVVETGRVTRPGTIENNLAAYLDYLQGRAVRPMTRLVDARSFVALCDLVFVAAGHIHSVPEEYITRVHAPDEGGEYVAINGLDDAVNRFLAEDLFPSEQGAGWAAAGGRATASQLGDLAAVIARMQTDLA